MEFTKFVTFVTSPQAHIQAPFSFVYGAPYRDSSLQFHVEAKRFNSPQVNAAEKENMQKIMYMCIVNRQEAWLNVWYLNEFVCPPGTLFAITR